MWWKLLPTHPAAEISCLSEKYIANYIHISNRKTPIENRIVSSVRHNSQLATSGNPLALSLSLSVIIIIMFAYILLLRLPIIELHCFFPKGGWQRISGKSEITH